MKWILVAVIALCGFNKSGAQTPKKNEALNKKILGAWTYETTGNATFQISEKNIFYVEHLVNYKYSLKKDCINIFFNDHTLKGKIEFMSDTMIITTKNDRQKYWRFKN